MAKPIGRALALAALLLTPCASASASSPWGWLDKLSGPGPFTCASRIYAPIPFTTFTDDGVKPFGESLDSRVVYGTFETARFIGEPNANFDGEVNVGTFQGVFYVHLATIAHMQSSALSAVDVGAGIGIYRFDGPGVLSDGKANGSIWRGSIPIRIRLTPSELFARQLKDRHNRWRNGLAVFSYVIGWDVLPGTFDSTDFAARGSYKSSGNKPKTYGVVIDIAPVLFNK